MKKDRLARPPVAVKRAPADQHCREARNAAEGRLRESESNYKLLFASNPLPMWVYDLETLEFLEVNDAALARYGYPRDEFLRMRITDIRPSEDVRVLLENLNQTQPGFQESGSRRLQLKNGQVIQVQITSHTLEWNGRPAALVVAQDVTEQQRAQENLRASEGRYRQLYEALRDGFVRTTMDGRITEFNEVYRTMLEYEADELLNLRYQDVTPEKWHDAEAAIIEREVLTRGYSRVYESEYRRKDGTIFPVELRTYLMLDDAGEPCGMCAIVRDILQHKWAERVLREYEKVVENSQEVIAVVDREFRYVVVNEAFLKYQQMERTDVLGSTITEIIGKEAFEKTFKPHLNGCFLGKRGQIEMQCTYPHLGERSLLISYFPIEGAAGIDRAAYISTDITDRKRAEEALKESEEKYRSVVLNIPEIVWTFNTKDGIAFISPNVESLSGYTVEELYRSGEILFWTRVHSDDRQQLTKIINTAALEGKPFEVEFRVRRKDERWIWVRLRGVASYVKDGVQHRQGLLCDITGEKLAEVALRESENRYRSIFESTGDAILLTKNQVILDCSGRALELFRCERGQLIGKTILGLSPDSPPGGTDLNRAIQEMTERALSGENFSFEWQFRGQDGSLFDAQIRLTRLDIRGEAYLLAVVTDITARKRAEESLVRSENRFRRLAESNLLGVCTGDDSGRLSYANHAYLSMVGYSPEDLAEGRLRWDTLIPPDQQSVTEYLRQQLKAKGLVEPLETVHIHKNGRRVPVLLGLASLEIHEGRREAIGFVMDLTSRKQAEAKLKESEERFRKAFKIGADAFYITTLGEGKFTEANDRFEDVFGYTREEALGKTALELGLYVDPAERAKIVAELKARGHLRNREVRFRKKTGEIITALLSINVLEENGELLTLGVVRDVTERKRREQALVRLRKAVDASGEVVFITDPDGVFTFANPEFTRLYGYSGAEVVGKLTPRILKSGMISAEQYARFWDAILNKRVARGEITNKTKDGRLVTVESSVNAILNENGLLSGFLAIQRDATGRKRLEEQFLQAQKMEAVGRLAAGVAHDFNNLLTIINGYSDLLLEKPPTAELAREALTEIKGAGERAAGLTRQLLAFSRREIRTARVLDLNRLVSDSAKMLRRLIGEDIQLELLPDPDLAMIKADQGQIEQILMNLAVNARDAMPKGGRLSIETCNFQAEEEYASAHYPMSAGQYVMLAMSDTGEGMDAETRARIFEPFFTTKGVGKGTGLGLATVYGIVKQSGGYTWVYSEPGHGTTFRIYFPAVDGIPEATARTTAAVGGSETILLVEDEPNVRAVARNALQSRGYTVIEAGNCMEALLLSAQNNASIDLLLTDLVMPVMSGRELADKLAKLRPQMKILYMSGYTDDTVVRHGVLEAGMAFLQKPFSPESLARKVREVLDKKSET